MRIAVAAFLAIIAIGVKAQQNPDTIAASAAKILTEAQPLAEVSIGIVKDGKVYRYNYGTTNTPTGKTIYELGSITRRRRWWRKGSASMTTSGSTWRKAIPTWNTRGSRSGWSTS